MQRRTGLFAVAAVVLIASAIALTSGRNGLAGSVEPPSLASDDSLRVMIGQMLLVGFRGLTVTEDSSIYDDIVNRHIGGVILFDYDAPSRRSVRNIESPAQLRRLTSTLQSWVETPLLISIDQEGGRVNRLKSKFGFPVFPSAGYLGGLDDPDSTAYYAELTASALADAGVNLNFAPVVDLNTNPDNPVIGKIQRSFGADPDVVVRNARIVIQRHHQHGVATALKHFPGHGSSRKDTHLGLVDVTDSWSEEELEPYRQLVKSSDVWGVMTAHVVNRKLDESGVSSTLSPSVIGGVLRNEIGYDGVVYSDDLQMGAIREHYSLEEVVAGALAAGVDILTFANNSEYEPDIAARAAGAIEDLILSGQVTRSRVEESYGRILRLKSELSAE